MPTDEKPTALILVAGVINYYYDVIGYRIAEALRNIGMEAQVHTLRSYVDRGQSYDWFFMVNISEITVGYGDADEAMRRISQIRARSSHSAMILLECVRTNWFAENLRLTLQAEIEMLLDLGFHDQRADAPAKAQRIYRFLFSGLTNYERDQAQRVIIQHAERPIPWTFVGHLETRRVKFAQRLMQGMDKGGFLYLPVLTHIVEGGPHLNGQQLQSVLERTRYYIWCAHHNYFYMESERFRNSVMAGAVPIKVSDFPPPNEGEGLPFQYLQLREADFDEHLRAFDFFSLRQRFLDDYLRLPSLEDGVSQLIYGETAHARLHA